MSKDQKRSNGEGTVYARKNKPGHFSLAFYVNGERKYRSFISTKRGSDAQRRDAEKRLASLIKSAGEDRFVDYSKITLTEWRQEWLTKKECVAAHRLRCEQLLARVEKHIGREKLQKINKAMITSTLAKIQAEGWDQVYKLADGSTKTVHREISETGMRNIRVALRDCLATAFAEEVIPANPFDRISAKRGRKKAKAKDGSKTAKVKALSAEQLGDLLAGIKAVRNGSWYPLTLMGAASGARLGELLALRWQDLNTETGLLTIARVVTRGPEIEERTKTTSEGEGRELYLPADVVDYFKALRIERAELILKGGLKVADSDLMFPRDVFEPGEPWDPTLCSGAFIKLAKQVGFPGFSFHGLRHTAATLLLTDRTAVHLVSARLGHSQASTTQNIYAHAIKQAEQQVAGLAGSYLKVPKK